MADHSHPDIQRQLDQLNDRPWTQLNVDVAEIRGIAKGALRTAEESLRTSKMTFRLVGVSATLLLTLNGVVATLLVVVIK